MESLGLSVQEKKRKIDFQDGGHLGFPISTILATFDLQVTLMVPSKFSLSVQEKKRKIDFQDGGHGDHFGFPIGTILAIFDLQVTLMLPTKYQVNWPFGSGEEAKNRFSRWRPPWISDRHDFSYFLLAKLHDMYLYKTTTFPHQPLKSISKVAVLHRFYCV